MDSLIYTFRNPSIEDANQLARIHLTSFPNFFLSSLGLKFLESFYRCIIISPECIGTVLCIDNKVNGFAIGNAKNQGFYKELIKRHFFELCFAGFSEIIKSPTKIIKMIKSVKSTKSIPQNLNSKPCLLSICILPNMARKGAGTMLLKNFEFNLTENNFHSYFLTTDKNGNESVNNFYLKNKFEIQFSFTQGKNRKMNLYYKEI